MNIINPPTIELSPQDLTNKEVLDNTIDPLLERMKKALNNSTDWKEQVYLSLDGMNRILTTIDIAFNFDKEIHLNNENFKAKQQWVLDTFKQLQNAFNEYKSYFESFNQTQQQNATQGVQELQNKINEFEGVLAQAQNNVKAELKTTSPVV
ncbi:hypothetical protein [Helicobacter cetorum]|uniref:Uncharacterized protein n=1 Tax=Helicobacter cetorum (strain ATCC BAA-540 / CCUG 52418 / MIT 99-5656) TaxID=1163745 RepID=I0EUI0_HELCM|nr:hypothetical protein [Helicobacter cetorum]AFI06599.1 hypothetical protein HCD_08075 [Helicobacter cetorum MIT 99-5656]